MTTSELAEVVGDLQREAAAALRELMRTAMPDARAAEVIEARLGAYERALEAIASAIHGRVARDELDAPHVLDERGRRVAA